MVDLHNKVYHLHMHPSLLQLQVSHHQHDLLHLKTASIAINGLMLLAYMQASMRQLKWHPAQLV